MIGNAWKIISFLSGLSAQEREKEWELSEIKPKRSYTQNSYYWVLCTKIADVLRISKNRVHNMMLRQYGQPEMLGGQLVRTPIPDTEDAENNALDAEMFHLKPTSHVRLGDNGQMYRTYILMRGSSTYDSREMSILLDGTIDEAKSLDIEVLPPDEIAKIKALDRKE